MSTENQQNVDDILRRLMYLKKFDTYQQVADFLGEDNRTLSAWKTRNSRVAVQKISAKCSDVDLKWLLTGEGNEGKDQQVTSKDPTAQYLSSNIMQVGVYALVGAGNPNDIISNEPLEWIAIPKDFYKPSTVTIKVRGKSMEPLIRDGAYIGIERDDKWIVSGEIYAVWLPYEGAVIKRLYLDMEKITLKSDNLQFPDIQIPLQGLDENFIQGRVKWVLQML